MNLVKKICRGILTFLWRLVLAVIVIAAVAVLGVAMVLNMLLNGPSETARDQLVTTLMEYELTAEIPGIFLDQAVIDSICLESDSLTEGVSDTSLIEVGTADESKWLSHPDGVRTKTEYGETYTAHITLLRDSMGLSIGDTKGDNYAGFTEDGILVVTASSDSADILALSGRCGKILMMDGKINTGLYNSNSGCTTRMAIGQCADGTVIIAYFDGITEKSLGGTYRDMIDIMYQYGAVNACCLSGSAWASED